MTSNSQNIRRSKDISPKSNTKSFNNQKKLPKVDYLKTESKTKAQFEFYQAVQNYSSNSEKILDFRKKGLNDKDAKELAYLIYLKFSEIEVLDLGNNYFTTKSLKHFLKNLQEINIREIYMDKNNIDITTINYLISFTKYNKTIRKFVFGRERRRYDLLRRINKI